MKASESKLVNSILNINGIHSLSLGGLYEIIRRCISYLDFLTFSSCKIKSSSEKWDYYI